MLCDEKVFFFISYFSLHENNECTCDQIIINFFFLHIEKKKYKRKRKKNYLIMFDCRIICKNCLNVLSKRYTNAANVIIFYCTNRLLPLDFV